MTTIDTVGTMTPDQHIEKVWREAQEKEIGTPCTPGGHLVSVPLPASPHTDSERAAALLDQLDALRAAATPGPWQSNRWAGAESKATIDPPDARNSDPYVAVCWRNADDAALIVAAVNNAPKLVAALRGVLALHQTVPEGSWLWCQHCRLQDDVSCPTVHSLAAALTDGTPR